VHCSVDLIELQRLVVDNLHRGFFGARGAAVDPDVGRDRLFLEVEVRSLVEEVVGSAAVERVGGLELVLPSTL
jgi:hypothetical protein